MKIITFLLIVCLCQSKHLWKAKQIDKDLDELFLSEGNRLTEGRKLEYDEGNLSTPNLVQDIEDTNSIIQRMAGIE